MTSTKRLHLLPVLELDSLNCHSDRAPYPNLWSKKHGYIYEEPLSAAPSRLYIPVYLHNIPLHPICNHHCNPVPGAPGEHGNISAGVASEIHIAAHPRLGSSIPHSALVLLRR